MGDDGQKTDGPHGADDDALTAPPLELGVYDKPSGGLTASYVIALALSGLWLAGAVAYFLLIRPAGQKATTAGLAMSAIAIVAPLVLIWIAAGMARRNRALRQEAAHLRASLAALRSEQTKQSRPAEAPTPVFSQRSTSSAPGKDLPPDVAPAIFSSTRDQNRLASVLPADGAAQPVPPAEQPSLALDSPAEVERPVLTARDFIGALNFPESERDKEGFNQLRRALADPISSKLVRAAQDVLTLLSQEGIYMDDLNPERSRPELWRQFAEGERGAGVSGIGGIHDRSAMALTAGRMRADPVFRDAVHHFLRQFDTTFARFAEHASDDNIIRLSNTRTARAFMLLGRVAGTFD